MLDKCKVDGARLEQTQALAQAAAEDKKVCLGLSRMTVIQGRPRLRDRVSTLLKTDERKAQIDRINEQVRQLYGPLLACVTATRSAYAAMVRQHSPDGTARAFIRAVRETPAGAEGVSYRCACAQLTAAAPACSL